MSEILFSSRSSFIKKNYSVPKSQALCPVELREVPAKDTEQLDLMESAHMAVPAETIHG